jgi:hypothetical protein
MSWRRYWFVALMGIAAVGLFLASGPAMGGGGGGVYRSPMPKVSAASSRTVSSGHVLPSWRSTTPIVIAITSGPAQPQARSQYFSIWGPDGTMKTFWLEGGLQEIQIRLAVVRQGAMALGH